MIFLILRGKKKPGSEMCQNVTKSDQNGHQMVPKVIKNAPKSDQNGALGSHGTPLGDVLGQRRVREGHQAPIRASMVAQREPKERQRELMGRQRVSQREPKGAKREPKGAKR